MQSDGISFASQTYSWQMSGDRYRARVAHMAGVVGGAGFAGLEIEVFMLGGAGAPELSDALSANGLQLASLAFAGEWSRPVESDEEHTEADRAIELVRSFPGAKLLLSSLPDEDRSDLEQRQANAIACYNAVGLRALEAGVQPTVHPNSPPGSVFRVRSDYEVLLEGLDPHIGFTPDVGHVAAGAMDPFAIVEQYLERIDHIHFKDRDASGEWAATGKGVIDFAAITSLLARSGYRGWIVLEDESEEAMRDPDGAARRNADYARRVLLPAVAGGSSR
jgi:inosose dehydratase